MDLRGEEDDDEDEKKSADRSETNGGDVSPAPAAPEPTPARGKTVPALDSAPPTPTAQHRTMTPFFLARTPTPGSGRIRRPPPLPSKHGDVSFPIIRADEEPAAAAELEDVEVTLRMPVYEQLPLAVFRELSEAELNEGLPATEPYRQPEHYVRFDWRPDDDLEAFVDYDMDTEDEEWLEDYNRHNPNDQLRVDQFEMVIDRLEKAAFRIDRNSHSTMRQLAIEESDDVCVVCQDGMSEDANQIVYCDGCDMAVHQACYGIRYIPEGSWKCARCLATTPARCVLCHDRSAGQALRLTMDGQWVHIACALWAPGVRLTFIKGPGEIDYLNEIDISGIPEEAFQKTCYLCNKPGGVCIDCDDPGCTRAFHVPCARANRLRMKCAAPNPNWLSPTSACEDAGPGAKQRMHTIPPAPTSQGSYKAWCNFHKPVGRIPYKKKRTAVAPPTPSVQKYRQQRRKLEEQAHAQQELARAAEGSAGTEQTQQQPQPQQYSCECGATFATSQSKAGHCQHCKTHIAAMRAKASHKDPEATASSSDEEKRAPQPTSGRASRSKTPADAVKEESARRAAGQSVTQHAGVTVSRVLPKMHGVTLRQAEAIFPYWVRKRVSRNDNPLLKMFDPSIIMLSHPTITRNPRIKNNMDSYQKMVQLRQDLERARTLLDIVVKRERLKMEMVVLDQRIAETNAHTPLQNQMAHALMLLRKLDKDEFFRYPVTELQAPGYHSIIEKPMDFQTMAQKIDEDDYPDWDAFTADFELICSNATTYNGPQTVFHKAAKMLRQKGQAVISAASRAPLPPPVAIPVPLPADVARFIEPPSPTKRLQVTLPDALARLRTPPSQPISPRTPRSASSLHTGRQGRPPKSVHKSKQREVANVIDTDKFKELLEEDPDFPFVPPPFLHGRGAEKAQQPTPSQPKHTPSKPKSKSKSKSTLSPPSKRQKQEAKKEEEDEEEEEKEEEEEEEKDEEEEEEEKEEEEEEETRYALRKTPEREKHVETSEGSGGPWSARRASVAARSRRALRRSRLRESKEESSSSSSESS